MFCIKKFFILFYFAYFFSLLPIEKTSSKITIFYLPDDVFAYILDVCLEPEKKVKKSVQHLILDYMFYRRIPASNKKKWKEAKDLFLQQYIKINYIKNVYGLYCSLKLVSSDMALKIKNYFFNIFNKKFTPLFLSTKTSIYVIYLSNLLSYLKYQVYYNRFQYDDHSRILYLISVNYLKNTSSLSVTINMDTNVLSICANIHRYYQWSKKQYICFRINKIAYPNKKVNLFFDTPNKLFDENQCLKCSFYEKFLKPKDAKRMKYYIDFLIIKNTYRYYQSPPTRVVLQYKNIQRLEDIDLRFMISYKLNKNICLHKQLFG